MKKSKIPHFIFPVLALVLLVVLLIIGKIVPVGEKTVKICYDVICVDTPEEFYWIGNDPKELVMPIVTICVLGVSYALGLLTIFIKKVAAFYLKIFAVLLSIASSILTIIPVFITAKYVSSKYPLTLIFLLLQILAFVLIVTYYIFLIIFPVEKPAFKKRIKKEKPKPIKKERKIVIKQNEKKTSSDNIHSNSFYKKPDEDNKKSVEEKHKENNKPKAKIQLNKKQYIYICYVILIFALTIAFIITGLNNHFINFETQNSFIYAFLYFLCPLTIIVFLVSALVNVLSKNELNEKYYFKTSIVAGFILPVFVLATIITSILLELENYEDNLNAIIAVLVLLGIVALLVLIHPIYSLIANHKKVVVKENESKKEREKESRELPLSMHIRFSISMAVFLGVSIIATVIFHFAIEDFAIVMPGLFIPVVAVSVIVLIAAIIFTKISIERKLRGERKIIYDIFALVFSSQNILTLILLLSIYPISVYAINHAPILVTLVSYFLLTIASVSPVPFIFLLIFLYPPRKRKRIVKKGIPGKTLQYRLEQLKALYDDKVISEDEYKEKRDKYIDLL